MGDLEVLGKAAVLGDNTDVVDGGETEWLDRGEQRGVVDEGRDRGDFDGKSGGYFVPRTVLGTTKGVDADELVRVLVVLVNAQRVWEDNGRRDVFLVI